MGVIETTTNVRVQSLPRPPIDLEVSEVTPTSVRLSWSYPGRPTEVQYYVIQYKPKLASWDYKEISGAITTFYDIRGLTPYTEYEFVVLGVNNVGRGDKSTSVVATTGETEGVAQGGTSKRTRISCMSTFRLIFGAKISEPGSAPRNLQVRPLSATTMLIQWDEPEAQSGLVTVSFLSLKFDHRT